MEQKRLDHGLKVGLDHLRFRIEALKAKIKIAQGIEKMDEIGRLDQLEHRYKELEDRMRQLSHESPGFRRNMKNEFEKLSFDLSGAFDEFIMWVDSGFQRSEKG